MARRATTLQLDEDLLGRIHAAAMASGRDESDVVEEAVRRYLGLEVLDRIWARDSEDLLAPDEALALAYSELRAFRAERSPAD
jgi:hypothetical protein